MHPPSTKRPEKRRTAAVFALTGAMYAATAVPAFAIHNPIVVDVRPTVPNGARGHVTFFQAGSNVDVTVILGRDRKGTQSVGIHKGTCRNYDPRPEWIVVGVSETTQETRVPNTSLARLLGHALVIHRMKSRSSPAIGCANIRDRG